MSLKKLIVGTAHAVGLDIGRYDPGFDPRCVSLAPSTGLPSRGNVLLSYILPPFLRKADEPISTAHNNHLESVLIAQAFQELGYAVDVIDFRNDEFAPTKPYAFFVSARTHLATLAPRLNRDCIKIAHLDTAHFLFNNAAAYARALALQQRRGFTSNSIRIVEHNLAVEACDYAAVLGGEFCMSTYGYARKPMFRLPVPTIGNYTLDPDKDYDAARRSFLWLGSFGFVHKGLDLTLEAFYAAPQLQLSVCGRLDLEQDFAAFYRRELYEAPNIHAVGWVDVAGPQFLGLAARSLAVVFPSCSESESCSVLTCMRAGLIPVVTREAGIDVRDFGVLLPEPSVEAIREAVEELSALPAARLREMSRRAWEYTRENHSPEAYSRAYRAMLDYILQARSAASV
jgi:glycosyltransferase involved in cell wall biosynthesis